MSDCRDGLLRALCFHDAWEYAPTVTELVASWDGGGRGENRESRIENRESRTEVRRALDDLLEEKRVVCRRGRVTWPGREGLVSEHEQREALLPRKLRVARRVARWLACLGGVRFVALCNTTALAQARDEGDLDFFVVTKAGALWQTRALAALPFKFLGRRPGGAGGKRDAVCLSFFIDDTALNLSSFMLAGGDPYFRHWFMSLLPLLDDGVGEDLWRANADLLKQHPWSAPWILHPELAVLAGVRLPALSLLEASSYRIQEKRLPATVRTQANVSTHVVVQTHVLKLHTTDQREEYRTRYAERCRTYGVASV